MSGWVGRQMGGKVGWWLVSVEVGGWVGAGWEGR